MHAVHGYYDGELVHPLEPVDAAPNSKVIVTFLEECKRPLFAPTTFEDVAGCLRYDGPPKTLEEMKDAIRRGVEEQWG